MQDLKPRFWSLRCYLWHHSRTYVELLSERQEGRNLWRPTHSSLKFSGAKTLQTFEWIRANFSSVQPFFQSVVYLFSAAEKFLTQVLFLCKAPSSDTSRVRKMSDKLAPTDRHRFEQDGTSSNFVFVFLFHSFWLWKVRIRFEQFWSPQVAHLEKVFSSLFLPDSTIPEGNRYLNAEQLRLQVWWIFFGLNFLIME